MQNNGNDAKAYLAKLIQTINRLDVSQIDHAISLIEQAWHQGQQVICFGNGGSALTVVHYVTDWNKSLYLATARPFRGRTLCDNMGLVTAYANDISYQDVFIEQLKNLLQPNDLVIAVSGSGNSENVIRAVNYANENGGITLGLCGYDGGKLKKIAQHSIWVHENDMQLAEDIHFIFGHIVMQKLCGYLKN